MTSSLLFLFGMAVIMLILIVLNAAIEDFC